MKVLHIIGSLDKSAGGPSRSVPQTCIKLAKTDMQIEIICRASPTPVEVPQSPNLKVRYLSIGQLIRFGFSFDKKKIDLIHLQHVWDPYIHVMAQIARLKGIPYIITPRGMLEPWIMNRNRWKKQIAMFLYQRKDLKKAKAIHATCEMEKENIQNLGITNPIFVIPNGIDLTRVPEQKTEYGTKKMVFLSRIHEKKGIEILLEAWKNLAIKNWQLEIAGEGDDAYIKSLLEKIKIANIPQVKLIGPRYGKEKWELLKSADIFVLPTYSENFGIVVAEALAVGVPVITTTSTPWHELETEQCGWWIDLSVENLRKALSEAIKTKPEQLREMGLRGRKLVEKKYDIRAVTKEMIRLYTNIHNQ